MQHSTAGEPIWEANGETLCMWIAQEGARPVPCSMNGDSELCMMRILQLKLLCVAV